MRSLFGLILIVLTTALYAETQEEAYYRAMKLEESGDISAALQAFEEAASLPGEYTEEIQGIIRDYQAALGLNDADSASSENPWEFHVAGELSLYGMHYKATGMDEAEMGGDLFLNVNPYVDYVTGAWSHTFAASVQGDCFLNNDNMSMLDTNDWNLFLGLEYTLFRQGLLLDVGYDFNIEGEKLSSDFYAWAEKDLYRFEKQRLGVVGWGYYQTSGPMSFALYGSWHRTVPQGLNGTVYVGAKYESDSTWILDKSSGDFAETIGKWIGPVFRSRVSYKFSNRITVELKMNLFYGFALENDDSDYGKNKKFYCTGGATVSWKHWKLKYYLGLERNYKRYYWVRYYKSLYNESTVLTQLKLGVKWDI